MGPMASSAAAFVAVCSSESSSPSAASLILARSSSSAAFSSATFFLGAELTSLRGIVRRIWSMGFFSGLGSSSSPGTGKGSRGSHALTTIGESSSLTAMVRSASQNGISAQFGFQTRLEIPQKSRAPSSTNPRPPSRSPLYAARASVRTNAHRIRRVSHVKIHHFEPRASAETTIRSPGPSPARRPERSRPNDEAVVKHRADPRLGGAVRGRRALPGCRRRRRPGASDRAQVRR